MLDNIDKKILTILQQDARITLNRLSEQVGLSKTPCQIRLKRLQSDGYILGFSARVNHDKLGDNHVAFVQVTLNDTKTAALKAFNKAVQNIPQIEQCHMIAASFDYLLKVRTKDMSDFRYLLGETISTLPYVKQTSTFVAMESVKDNEQVNYGD